MQRRQFARWIGLTCTAALAGCLGSDDSGDGDDSENTTPEGDGDGGSEDGETESVAFDASTPGDAVRTYVRAWQQNDVEAINDLIHEDAERGSVESAADVSGTAPEIQDIGDVSEAGDEASVSGLLSFPAVQASVLTTFELAMVGEEWRIVSISTDRSLSLDIELEFHDEEGEVTIEHSGGDGLAAGNLFVRGNGLAESGSWANLSDEFDGDSSVEPGDTVTVEVEDSYNFNVVWDNGFLTISIAGTVEL